MRQKGTVLRRDYTNTRARNSLVMAATWHKSVKLRREKKKAKKVVIVSVVAPQCARRVKRRCKCQTYHHCSQVKL